MSNKKFSKEVGQFGVKVAARMRYVERESVQQTVHLAQRVEKQGGTMRVDTGFLRASIQGGLGQMPRGETVNEGGHGGKRKYAGAQTVSGEPVGATLLRWNSATTTLFVGWTAGYARAREAKDGFLRLAAQQWDVTVAKAILDARSRL